MPNPLVAYVEKSAGDALRAVVEYEDADIEVLYHRDDLEEATVERRTRSIYDQIVQARTSRDDALAKDLGRKRVTLQIRQEAVLIHLLETRQRGHIISLEPEAARDLVTFLNDCLQYVE